MAAAGVEDILVWQDSNYAGHQKEISRWQGTPLLHFLTLFTMAKKAKARVILVKLVSSAGTGYNYVKSRPRISPKLSMMKYDPMGKSSIPKLTYGLPFSFPSSPLSSFCIVKQHVLFTETKKMK